MRSFNCHRNNRRYYPAGETKLVMRVAGSKVSPKQHCQWIIEMGAAKWGHCKKQWHSSAIDYKLVRRCFDFHPEKHALTTSLTHRVFTLPELSLQPVNIPCVHCRENAKGHIARHYPLHKNIGRGVFRQSQICVTLRNAMSWYCAKLHVYCHAFSPRRQ